MSGDQQADAGAGREGGWRRPGAAALAAVLVSLLVCAGLLVYGSGRGLDLTDESFYLIWTARPDAYDLTYQPFGYLLHPLFRLVGGDLQLYRLAGFAITAAAGAFLGGALPGASAKPRLFALYGAVAALTIFFPWIITPSYNSAANVGAMLMLGGVLRALGASARTRLLGALATGAGLCIAAFSKPPLFVLAVAAVGLTALGVRRARAPLAGALALGAALVALILGPGEIAPLVRRIVTSQHVLALPNTPLRLPGKVVRDWAIVPWPLSAAAALAAASLALPRWRGARWLGYAAIAAALGYAPTVAADAAEARIPDFLGLALTTAAAGYAGAIARGAQVRWAPIFALLAAPSAVALGTFNNQWFQFNFSMAFAFLALFVLAQADPVRLRGGAATALAAAGPVAVMLLAAFAPYSLPASIFDQQAPVAIPLAHGVIRVDPQTASFVRGAGGRAAGATLVDLSGTGPGVAVVLGAHAPVLAWLNPATPSWPDVVWSRLSPQARASAAFVTPVWPLFQRSAPAQWLAARERAYCRTPLPPMTFWGETRRLELWRPCAPARS